MCDEAKVLIGLLIFVAAIALTGIITSAQTTKACYEAAKVNQNIRCDEAAK